MNRLILVFVLLTLPGFVFSQQTTDRDLWHLTIVDSATTKGIASASIAIGTKIYFNTNVEGVVSINKSLINFNYSIRFSCIGYKTVIIKLDQNKLLPDTIRLSSSVNYLEEVSIKSSKSAKILFGSPTKLHDTHMHPYPDEQFAQYIPNQENITGTIASVEFELNDDLHGIEMPFKVRLRSRSKDSVFPDTDLVKDSIIVYNPQKKHQLNVNLSRYHIQVPKNGFFVVFQACDSAHYSKETILYEGHNQFKIPGISIYLKEKNNFEGECCSIDPPDRKGFYCLLGGEKHGISFADKKDNWIVYAEGINFGIRAVINPEN